MIRFAAAAALRALVAAALLVAVGPRPAGAAVLCVFDPVGANGPNFAFAQDWQAASAGWGMQWELKPYTHEPSAANDFKAGKCDGVVITGVRTQQFNRSTYSIEAMGAVPSYEVLRDVVARAGKPNWADVMSSGSFETVGVFPAGAVYLYVRDRNVTDIGDLAGKRIATLDFDKAAKTMVQKVGATVVPADVSTVATKFNNGEVDACYLPVSVYEIFELHKGLGTAGGVVDYPLAQLTLQVLVHKGKVPAGFGDQARAWAATRFDSALKIVKEYESKVAPGLWIRVPADKRVRYDTLFRDVRVQLRDEGAYDAVMLGRLKKARCRADATRAECSDEVE